jgi:hypothetical protein
MDLVERMRVTQKTVDRFKGKMFEPGKIDCIQLIIGHAAHAGVKIEVEPYGDWESAAAVLRRRGYRTLGEAMDDHFERIDPSRALFGDFIEAPGGNGFSSLSVAVGNGRVLGFHEEIPHADIIQPLLMSGAWTLE